MVTKMFEYGNWKIIIDEEKTRGYYSSLPVQDNQANKNFQLNVKSSDEAMRFFDELCVDLSKLKIDGILIATPVLKKEKHWRCNADIYVFGEIISAPKTYDEIYDEAEKLNWSKQRYETEIETNDTNITFDKYSFDISNPSEWEPGEECPEGAIYISMDYAELHWLLQDKCEDIEIEHTAIYEKILEPIMWKLQYLFVGKRKEKKENKMLIQAIIKYFSALGICLSDISRKEMLRFKNEYVNHFTDDNEIKKASLPSKKTHNLLWHVFSYEDGKAKEGQEAIDAFDKIEKRKAVVYIDDIDTAFLASDVSILNSKLIEKMCDELEHPYMDIVFSADDYSWTYCRTHEVDWLGPYFYKK